MILKMQFGEQKSNRRLKIFDYINQSYTYRPIQIVT